MPDEPRPPGSEERLLETQRTLDTLLSDLPGMVFRCLADERWTMEFVSTASGPLTGYAPEDLVHNRKVAYGELIHPDDRARVRSEVEAATAGNRPFRVVYRVRTASGDERWFSEQGRGVPRGDDFILEGYISDITDRRRLEERLESFERMEALARLAGGVAHDFNNLLAVLSGYCESVLDGLSPETPLRRQIQEMRRTVDRAAALNRQLLTFGRRQPCEPRLLDLNSVLRDMEALLGRLLGPGVSLEMKLDARPGVVEADPGQIEQIVMNLAINARDAMSSGGSVWIETYDEQVGDHVEALHPEARPGGYVVLGISDTGHGIDPATRARIFEPFFTTKPPGEGTGLGLSTTHGIVKQIGGFIDVESEPGQGTVFRICLPRAAEAAEHAEPAQAAAGEARGEERILVVEDEQAVRQLIAEVLSIRGYEVWDLPASDEALERVLRDATPSALLITDLVLARMDGRDLARNLLAAGKVERVLYVSGTMQEIRLRNSLLASGVGCLPKPFSLQGLVRQVRDLLDGPAAQPPCPGIPLAEDRPSPRGNETA